LIVCSALFAIGVTLSWIQVPLAIVTSLAFAWWGAETYFPEQRRRVFGVALAISAAVIVGAIIVSGLVYDVSWDGQTYHAEAIIQLANGWNPFRQASPDGVIFPIYMSFFAKGPWILSASIFKFTGVYEQGKAFHLILIFACLMIALATFSSFRSLSRR